MIAEKMLTQSLMQYLEYKGFLPQEQFGFRSQRSCGAAISYAISMMEGDDWDEGYETPDNLDKKEVPNYAGMIACDARNAFGICDHDLLIKTIEPICSDIVVNWVRSFLKRSFKICLRGYFSKERKLPMHGLPQGAGLSPLLYILFTQPVAECLKENSPIAKFIAEISEKENLNTEQEEKSNDVAITDNSVNPQALHIAAEDAINILESSDHLMNLDDASRQEPETAEETHTRITRKEIVDILPMGEHPFGQNVKVAWKKQPCIYENEHVLSMKMVPGASLVIDKDSSIQTKTPPDPNKSLGWTHFKGISCFADDCLVIIRAPTLNAARRIMRSSAARVLDCLECLGVATAPEKTQLVLYSKYKTDPKEKVEITVRDKIIESQENIKYLGIVVDDGGKLAGLEMQNKILKGRFGTIREKVRKINFLTSQKDRAIICRGLFMGTAAHGQDYGPYRSNQEYRMLQKTLNASIRGDIKKPHWIIQKEKKEGKYEQSDRTMQILEKYGIPSISAMDQYLSINSLNKIMITGKPEQFYERIKNRFKVTDAKTGEIICTLPDLNADIKEEKKAYLKSRFEKDRHPGFLTGEENNRIWRLRRWCEKARSIIDSEEIEIKFIQPERITKERKTKWPFHAGEEFNKLPKNLKNKITSKHFTLTLKTFFKNQHKHDERRIWCNKCREWDQLPSDKLPTEKKNEVTIACELERRLKIEKEIERVTLRNEKIIWRWWLSGSRREYHNRLYGDLILAKTAQIFNEIETKELIKNLLENENYGRTIDKIKEEELQKGI